MSVSERLLLINHVARFARVVTVGLGPTLCCFFRGGASDSSSATSRARFPGEDTTGTIATGVSATFFRGGASVSSSSAPRARFPGEDATRTTGAGDSGSDGSGAAGAGAQGIMAPGAAAIRSLMTSSPLIPSSSTSSTGRGGPHSQLEYRQNSIHWWWSTNGS